MPRRLNFPALRTVRRAVRSPHGALGVLAAEQGAPAASGNSALFRDSCQPRLSPLIDSVTGGSCECKMLLLFHYPNGFPGSVEERWEVTWDLGQCLLVDTGIRVFQWLPLAARVHAGTEPGSRPPEPLSLVSNVTRSVVGDYRVLKARGCTWLRE